VVEGHTGGPRDNAPFDYDALRKLYSGVWMVNNGYTKAMAQEAVASGQGDLVSFGRATISNPDLVRRLKEDAPLNELFSDTGLYGGSGAHGYTDYPALPA
jgi:N-ethylmaleimide reductase